MTLLTEKLKRKKKTTTTPYNYIGEKDFFGGAWVMEYKERKEGNRIDSQVSFSGTLIHKEPQ